MHKCEICGKETGNGIVILTGSKEVHICSKCIILSDDALAKHARDVMRTKKKSRENGEIKGKDAGWAAYWTYDCETPKFRKVK